MSPRKVFLAQRFFSRKPRRGASGRPPRGIRLRLEVLEERLAPAYNAGDIRTAYGINNISFGGTAGDGTGQVIAIVDAYNYPTVYNDLDVFDQNMSVSSGAPQNLYQQYGAASSFLKVFNQNGVDISGQVGNSGSGGVPGTDNGGGWEGEEALDVEWAHAMAPAAQVYLVEANDAGNNLDTAVSTAAGLAGVSTLSMSWGGGEYGGEVNQDNNFTWPNGHVPVTFFASTGDNGTPGGYPAYSPRVVAVGGTSLYLNGSTYNFENHWGSGGYGVSTVESEPSFQTGQGTFSGRSIPDVSLVADPGTGVSVYDSFTGGGGWGQVGGTSLSSPCWAGLVAIANQGRVLAGGTTLKGPTQTLPALYSLPTSDYHSISGSSFLLTGLGTPLANLAIPDLAAYGMASQLVVSTQPPGTVTAGSGFSVVVKAENTFGALDTSYNGSVTIALNSNPGGSTLGGTVTLNAVNGVATFSGLTLNKAANGYTLKATSGGLTQATTNSFNVKAAAATQLVVTTQPPGSVTAGSGFTVVVAAEDPFGNIDTTYASNVSISLLNNPGGSTLGGTLTAPASSGVATFSNLTLNKAGTGYTLKATSGGLANATTNGLNVVAAAATQLVVTTQPPASVTAGITFSVVVTAEDAFGNVATTYASNVSMAIANNPGGATLGGGTATASSGVATFSTLTLDKVGTGYTLKATSGSLASATTGGMNVTAAAATKLVVTTPPPASVTAGNAFSVVVKAEDSFGNVDPTYVNNITEAIANNPAGGTLGGTLTVAASGGVATFSTLNVDKAGTGYTLKATSGSLASATSNGFNIVAGAATHLVVTSQPPASVGPGTPFSVAVSAEDGFGNVDTSYGGSVSMAIAVNPAGGTLGGTLNVAASSGVALFSNLTIDAPGAGYKLQASATGLGNVTTSAFSVFTPATQLVITTQPPGSVTAGNAFTVVVKAEDAVGTVDGGFSGFVTIAIASNPAGGTLGGTVTLNATAGVATFSPLTLDKVGSGYTLKATSAGLSSATTTGITVTPGAATQVVVTAQPPSSVTAGNPFGLAVQAEDAYGNVDPSYSGTISVAIASNPGGGSLSGPLTASASSGLASFSGLSIDRSGIGYTLRTSAAGLGSGTSSGFSITARPATHLVVTTQPPAGVTAGNTFTVVVKAEDQFGNVDPTYAGNVSLAIANNPAAGTLGGTLSMNASGGVATFSNLTLDKAGIGYTLQTTSTGLASDTTGGITVTAGTATHLVLATQPAGNVTAGAAFTVVVQAEDNYGNVDPTFAGSESIALSSNPGGSTLGGTLNLSASGGIATFSTLTLDKASSGYQLTATAGGVSSAATNQFGVTAATATQLVLTTQPPASVTAGNTFTVVVKAEDPFGNVDLTFGGNINVAIAGNPGGSTLGGTVALSAAGGVAGFTDLWLNKVGSGYTLQASATGPSSATTTAISVTPGAATQLVVTTQPPGSVMAGSGFGLGVSAEDAYGNVDPTFSSNITVALANNPGGSTLGGTLTVASGSGLASFAGLTLTRAASGYTLQVSAAGVSPGTTGGFAVSAGFTTQLVLLTQPPSLATAGAGFGLVVAGEDVYGNVNPGYSGSVSLALAANPTGDTLGGTLTVSATNGLATFSGLTLVRAGAGYSVRATAIGLTGTTSSAFAVQAAAASQLVVATQPPVAITAGNTFSVVAKALDPFGNLDTSFAGNVSVAIASNPGGGTLGGTLTASASSGLASFSTLTLDRASSGYTLQVSSTGLGPATTGGISVTPGTATQLVVTTQPPSSVAAGNSFSLVVKAEDPFGNLDPTFTGSVAATVGSGPTGATLSGTFAATASNGVATFPALTLTRAGAYTLRTTGPGVSAGTTGTFSVTARAASQVAVTAAPAGVTAGSAFSVVVAGEDVYGNVDPNFSGPISLALASNPAGDTLGGTLTLNASGGQASFSNLTLEKAGVGTTLQTNSPGLGTAATGPITVQAGTATQLVVASAPPSSITAGSGFGLVVAGEDAYGNVDPNFSGPVTLALASNPGGSTLDGTLTSNASGGSATFSGLTLTRSGSGYTLQAASTGLSPGTSGTFSITAGAATQLAFTTQPGASVTAGSGFTVAVAAEDAFGNVDPTFARRVSVTLAGNPGGGTLGGTLTVSAGGGVATFSGLTLDKAGSGYALQASASSFTATSNAFDVKAGAATHLVVTTQPPASVTAGAPFGLTVFAEDGLGNLDTTFSGSVGILLFGNPGSATLGGSVTITASGGVAGFSGLSLDRAGSGYTLQVSSSGLGPATTSSISVTPGTATQLVVTTQPPSSVAAGSSFSLVVKAEDPFGNLDPTFGASVGLSLANNPGGSTLTGLATLNAGAGVASFVGLSLDRAGSGYTLGVSAAGLSSATTSPFRVLAGTATQLVVTSPPPASVTAGSAFGLVVSAEDSLGNVDQNFSGSISISLAKDPGSSTLGGSPGVDASHGVATFLDLTLNHAGSGYTLQLASGGLSIATTGGIDVLAGAATRLVVAIGPPSSVTAGAPFGLTVSAQDNFGNVDPLFTGSVSVAVANNPGGSTLGGTLSATASAGVASFSGLSLDRAGSGYTLQTSSTGVNPATTAGIEVKAGLATKLEVTNQPTGSVTAGSPISLTVAAVDGYGNVDPTFSGSVSVGLADNAGGTVLGGPVSVTASKGVATLVSLTLTVAADGYTIQATSPGLGSVTTDAINVTGAAATHLAVTKAPPSSVEAGKPFGFAVAAEDVYGNVDPTFNGSASVLLANNPSGSPLLGNLSTSVTGGVASFTGLSLNKASIGYALKVSSPGLPTMFLNTDLVVQAQPATHLVIMSAPQTLLAPKASFSIKVAAEDGLGNVDPTYAGDVQLSVASTPPGGIVRGTHLALPQAGYATFAALSLSQGGPYTLGFGSGGLNPTSLGLTQLAYQLVLPGVKEDVSSTAGVKVAALLKGHYRDADRNSKPGIAVTATTGTGRWQYSLNGKKWLNLGVVTAARARLLPASYQVRFLPGKHWTGQASLVFTAWDGSQGVPGGLASTVGAGPGSAFSVAAAAGTLRVTTVNHAPTWLAGAALLTPVVPGAANPAGDTVGTIFGQRFTDLERGTPVGVAVEALGGTTRGTWQYSLGGGAHWVPFGPINAGLARLLGSNDRIRFLPKALVGPVTLQAFAWDGSTGKDGATVNLAGTRTRGGTSAFSTAALTATALVNVAPRLASSTGPFLPATPEDSTSAVVKVTTLLGNSTAKGVGIVAATGPGSWQYSLNGSTWLALGGVSQALARLLPATAQVRFVTAGHQSGQATLTYRAWDETAGGAGALFAVPGTGGAFTLGGTQALARMNITFVNHAPTWTAATTSFTTIATGSVSPVGDSVIGAFGGPFQDVDSGTTTGIAVKALTGAGNGTWQYSFDGGVTWQDFGVVSPTATQLLSGSDRIRFVPAAGFAGTVALQALAWDGSFGSEGGTTDPQLGGTAFSTAAITARLLVNTAPTLGSTTGPVLPATTQDEPSAAYSVSALVTGQADSDPGALTGAAVVGTSGPGVWQYSLDGATWQAVGNVSESQALLLGGTAQVRFDPAAGQSGTATIAYRAWDQTAGTVGSLFHLTATGAVSAFSRTEASATLAVTAVNHPPAWTGSSAALTPILPGSGNPAGDTIAAVFGSAFSDPDGGTSVGAAVTAFGPATGGTWQYSLDGGSTWTAIGPVSAAAARLLSGNDRVRFLPDAGFTGAVQLQANAWDGGGGSDGGIANVSGSDFSAGVLTASGVVNTAPTLSGSGPTLPATPEDVTSAAVRVTALLNGATDADAAALKGVAIVGASGPGTWQYSLDGTNWQALGSVSGSSARLLPDTAQVRFVPALHQHGQAALTYRAWDQTAGTAGTLFAVTGTGGALSLSSTEATATLAVTLANHAPTWGANGVRFTTSLAGVSVASVFGGAFRDLDVGTTPGIAVTGLAGASNGTWQYSLDGGATWQAFGAASPAAARLLSGNDLIRFLPHAGFAGTVTLQAFAWDGSSGTDGGTDGGTVNLTGKGKTGGTTAFGGTAVTATCVVNQAPVLNA